MLSNSSNSMFSHNYMEEIGRATSVMVNPISGMPVHQQPQHQQNNIGLSVNSQFGNGAGSPFIVSSPSVIVKQSELKGFIRCRT
jgi:hypothetical protein